jgi:hypothetical protein
LGDADDAWGWTDGTSFIAVARSFLKGKDIASPATWTEIGLLLCHEYCHADASSSATHVHSPEFYESFHDGADGTVPQWTAAALKAVRPMIAKMNGKMNKNTLRWLDNLAAASGANNQFEANLLAAKAKQAPQQPKAKPPKPPIVKGSSYADLLGAQGYERQESAKGTQVWTKAGTRCEINTRHGSWRLTAKGRPERRGRFTPSLAEVF